MADTRNCPVIACDAIIFNDKGELLLIKRGKPPFLSMYAFPGGHMDIGETAEAACARELQEETGLIINPKDLALVGVYSDPARDPRRHCVGISYLGYVSNQVPKAADDAKAAMFVADYMNIEMAFDHKKILDDALKLRAQKLAA
jgi:8-oxo-dGTP diphosphatase